MKEHPILFSTEMVKAILDGRKTMTRRAIRYSHLWAYGAFSHDDNRGYAELSAMPTFDPMYSISKPCPYGQPGDLLWVRETFCLWDATTDDYEGDLHRGKLPVPNEHNIHFWKKRVQYRASTECDDESYQWRPSIHMPRWASRTTLQVTGVRVERVQDISANGAVNEGWHDECGWERFANGQWFRGDTPVAVIDFAYLWDSINAKRGYSWDSNPWVWVVEFKRAG